jgi:hypothetical protein
VRFGRSWDYLSGVCSGENWPRPGSAGEDTAHRGGMSRGSGRVLPGHRLVQATRRTEGVQQDARREFVFRLVEGFFPTDGGLSARYRVWKPSEVPAGKRSLSGEMRTR